MRVLNEGDVRQVLIPWNLKDSAWGTLAYDGPRPVDVLDKAICPTCRLKGTKPRYLDTIPFTGSRGDPGYRVAWFIEPCGCYVSLTCWEFRGWAMGTRHHFASWHRVGF